MAPEEMKPKNIVLYTGGPCIIIAALSTLGKQVCANSLHIHPPMDEAPVFNYNLGSDYEETVLELNARKKKRTEDIRRGWKDGKHNTKKPWER